MEELGYLLLGLAVVLLVVELGVPTGGLLGLLGLASFVAAGILLDVPWPVIVAVVLALGAFGLFLGQKALQAQKQERVMTGWEELLGAAGDVRVRLDPVGQIFVEGALWKARVDDGGAPVEVGRTVKVREVDGLTLVVEPATE